MLEVLNISRSTYYKYRHSADPDYSDYILIKKVFDDNKSTYGYRRVYDVLREDYGLYINHKKVSRIMKKYDIRANYVRRALRNNGVTIPEENYKDNLLEGNFKQPGWVTDITYLIWNNKRAYLSTILDLETRDWVAYKISFRNNNTLVIDTLKQAISTVKDPKGIILHSDQGSQYLSTEYKIICESNGILISHSKKGTPLDNAVIESFHSILKKETLYNNNITSLEEYINLVHEWMHFYNTTRRRTKKR